MNSFFMSIYIIFKCYFDFYINSAVFNHAVITVGDNGCFSSGEMFISEVKLYDKSSLIEILATTSASYNFEQINIYSLTVQAFDTAGLFTSGTVIISIQDENEAPALTSITTFHIQENAVLGTVLGYLIADDPDTSPT